MHEVTRYSSVMRHVCTGAPGGARTSECRDVMFDAPGMDCKREREELHPLPMILPLRTSREPCLVSCCDCSAAAAASSKKRM